MEYSEVNRPAAKQWFSLRSLPADAALNMALDEALLESASSFGKPILRFYSWSEPAASFGYFQKYAEVERMTHLRPLVRRLTGGGLVPHDTDWTYSVAIPSNSEWYVLRACESYRRMHEWIRAAFRKIRVETELAAESRKTLPGQCFQGYEKFDVLWQGRKIAGAAQRRTRHGLLIQGSVQAPTIGLVRADWENAMCKIGEEDYAIEWAKVPQDTVLQKRAAELAAKVYSSDAHNRRR